MYFPSEMLSSGTSSLHNGVRKLVLRNRPSKIYDLHLFISNSGLRESNMYLWYTYVRLSDTLIRRYVPFVASFRSVRRSTATLGYVIRDPPITISVLYEYLSYTIISTSNTVVFHNPHLNPRQIIIVCYNNMLIPADTFLYSLLYQRAGTDVFYVTY